MKKISIIFLVLSVISLSIIGFACKPDIPAEGAVEEAAEVEEEAPAEEVVEEDATPEEAAEEVVEEDATLEETDDNTATEEAAPEDEIPAEEVVEEETGSIVAFMADPEAGETIVEAVITDIAKMKGILTLEPLADESSESFEVKVDDSIAISKASIADEEIVIEDSSVMDFSVGTAVAVIYDAEGNALAIVILPVLEEE